MIALAIFAFLCWGVAEASEKSGLVKFLHFVWVSVVSYAVFAVVFLVFSEVTGTAGNTLVEIVASIGLYYGAYKLYERILK